MSSQHCRGPLVLADRVEAVIMRKAEMTVTLYNFLCSGAEKLEKPGGAS
jgi:hypothetical protein